MFVSGVTRPVSANSLANLRSGTVAPSRVAVIDIWHSDEDGRYDNSGFRYRGHQFTDGAGAFRFETVRPGRYPGRTPHIHVKVQGASTHLLTSQLFLSRPFRTRTPETESFTMTSCSA